MNCVVAMLRYLWAQDCPRPPGLVDWKGLSGIRKGLQLEVELAITTLALAQ